MSCADGTPKSSRTIYREIAELQRGGKRAALATPVRLSGSVPCVSQSRLLIGEDGAMLGTIGGGPLEAEVLQKARDVIGGDTPFLLDFDLTQDEASKAGMICGGSCTVLIEPVRPGRATEVYAAAAQSEAAGSRIVMVTILADRDCFHKLALLQDGMLVGSTGDTGIDAVVRELAAQYGAGEEPHLAEKPFRVCIQPLCSPPSLYVFGAGHIAVHVAHLAALVGLRTTVIDDRAEFADARRFPQADQVLTAAPAEAFAELPIGEGAYVVSITRGHEVDEEVLAHALRTPARYVGMIGSRRKVAAIHQRLRDRGFGEPDIARIHAPIGIDIGAETIEEIALSIVAELVAVRRSRPV